MTIGLHVACGQRLALAQHRQHPLGLVVGVLLAGVLVRGLESGEERDGAGCGELHVTAVGGDSADGDGRRGHACIGHLRGKRALPDEVVERELVGAQLALHLAGRAEAVARGTDGLMRLLRVLDLPVIATRRVGDVVLAVELGGLRARRSDGRLRQGRGVGAHVGDVAALVEALGDAHRALGIPAEASRRLLLQGRGHEGSLRAALARLLHHRADGVVDALERSGEGAGPGLVEDHAVAAGEAALLVEVAPGREALPLDQVEARSEGPGVEGGGEVPVRRGDEGDALALAVDDQTHGDGLHAPCRTRIASDLLPQHFRDGVAVEAIDDAPRLLGIHQLHVELARLLERIRDGMLGDLVEDHAAHRHLGLEHFQEVPGDRLALAVLVRGEQQFARALQLLLEFRDGRLLIGVHDVERREALVGVDGVLRPRLLALILGKFRCLAREIAHVADRGLHAEIAASPAIEVALDRLGLRRRLDDDEHTLRSHIRSCLPPPWDTRDRWGVCAARGCRCQICARRPRPTPYGGERRDGRSAMREGQVVTPRGR